MTINVHLVGDCALRLWGLTPRQRLERLLRGFPEARLVDQEQPLPASGEVLLLRADYAYDERVMRGLMKATEVALQDTRDGTVVAARGDAGRWHGSARLDGPAMDGLATVSPETVAEGLQAKLRKFDRPWVAPVRTDNLQRLEKALFSGAYKGVTDIITRCVWPTPARWATHLCIRLGLSPNAVTAGSYVFAILAGLWFWQGNYGPALLAAWFMTFLDTVDGKLARVTLTSSQVGDILDHALDLIHPPFWYIAWGIGLGASWQSGLALWDVLWVIIGGYIAGRLCEGAFKFAAPFSMFIWRPFDSVNRLITARRNPNLVILSLSWLAGHGDTGLVLVAAWTAISTLVLLVRALWAIALSKSGHEMQPWLSRVDPHAKDNPPLVRLFAPGTGPADV
jgi:hypothetical protein